jgi:hypothetical protein
MYASEKGCCPFIVHLQGDLEPIPEFAVRAEVSADTTLR